MYVASFTSLPSPAIMVMRFGCGHHWQNTVGGRDQAQDPGNLTHRMSEDITQGKELSSGSAGVTLIM